MNFMREISREELKEIQIGILDVFAAFCEKHGLHYWLDTGTLLGAIRHKGYIPWDDDIDVGMLREDYDKCITLFNAHQDRYQLRCIENNKDYSYPFAKILDTKTVLYEPNRKGNKIAVYIDVFVYDNAPDDEHLVQKMFRKRDFWNQMEYLRLPYNNKNTGIKKVIGDIYRIVPRMFPRWYFSHKIIQNSKKYASVPTKRVGNFTSISKVVGNIDIFADFIDVEFEGKKYKAPVGYDEWLSAFYKNYMELPPVEKRVPHHQFEAYWLEE